MRSLIQPEYKKTYHPDLVKLVDNIASLPSGPKRWGAAIQAWLLKNEVIQTPDGPKTAREYNALQIAYNKRIRDEAMNKFAATESGALRMGLSIPEGAWTMVKLIDPPAFNQGHGNTDHVSRNLKRFMEAFPQYTIGVY
jgi:hypothetical protein